MSDDTLEINPWPVSELVGRLACFGALAQRLSLEVAQGTDEDIFDLETDRFDLHAWSRLELAHALSPTELEILARPVSKLGEDHENRCLDATIAASTLGWALRLGEIDRLPMGESETLERDVPTWVPSPWDRVRDLSRRVRMRSEEDLATEREKWELIFWRLSLEDDKDSREALKDVVEEVAAINLIPVLHGDFATDAGVAISDLDEDKHAALLDTATIRLRTLNWICGLGETWDSAPLILED